MGSEFENLVRDPNDTKISVDSGQFIDLVASKAAQEVQARNKRRSTSARAIGFALGLLAVGCLGAMFYFEQQDRLTENNELVAKVVGDAMKSPATKAEFERAVETEVRGAIEGKLATMSAKIDSLAAYQRLVALSLHLDLNETFSNDDRDEILILLEKLKVAGGYKELPGFNRYLSKIVDSFTSAYQVAAVEQVDDLFRDDLGRISDIPRWMTNHFGRVYVTSNNLSDAQSRQSERLRYYSAISKQNHNPEVSLLWDLISQFEIAGEARAPSVDAVFAQVELLSEEERGLFGRGLLEEATASERDPADLRRLATIVTKLVETYKRELIDAGIEIE